MVLWGQSERTNARLEVFTDEGGYKLHQTYQASARCTYMEEVKNVESRSYDNSTNAINVTRKSSDPLTFASCSDTEHTAWLTVLNRELARRAAEAILVKPIDIQLQTKEKIRVSERGENDIYDFNISQILIFLAHHIIVNALIVSRLVLSNT